MTLKELITITDNTINIMTAGGFPSSRYIALTIEDGLLATDGAFSEAFLNSEITSITTGSDGSLCIELNYKMEE